MRLISLLFIFILIAPMLAPAQGTPVDDRIYDAVRRKLADDVEVKGAGIEVVVKSGAVILQGRVHDEKAREKAGRIAKKVKGVTSVDNKLKLLSDV